MSNVTSISKHHDDRLGWLLRGLRFALDGDQPNITICLDRDSAQSLVEDLERVRDQQKDQTNEKIDG